MINDGEKIWVSNNGVYLAKKVEPKYFIVTIYG
jgi:RNA:NAD 2'-phosphotransferase (TPT1/KptA family)